MDSVKEAKKLLLEDSHSCDNCGHRNGYACMTVIGNTVDDEPLPSSNICGRWIQDGRCGRRG